MGLCLYIQYIFGTNLPHKFHFYLTVKTNNVFFRIMRTNYILTTVPKNLKLFIFHIPEYETVITLGPEGLNDKLSADVRKNIFFVYDTREKEVSKFIAK